MTKLLTKCNPFRALIILVIVSFWTSFSFAQVTVNPGGNVYTTVNAAFTAINAGTHTGNITIAIGANTTEPALPVVLVASGVGAANYSAISIYPTASGVVVSGTGTASRGLLEFNGADNITINGNLNNGTGSTRDLTIQNNAATASAQAVLWFQSSATTPQLGCNNIEIKNTVLRGNADVAITRTSTTYQTIIAFSSTSFPATTSQTALNNSNIIITNNEFLRCLSAIHIGQSTTAALPGVNISNNIFGSNTLADYIIWRAVYLANSSNGIVEKNTVQNLKSIVSSTSGAIEISGATSSSHIIRKNIIRGVHNTSSGGWGSAGIYLNGGNNHIVDNNVIYDLKGANYSSVITTFNAYGIRLAAGTGHKVWYNSVHLFGTVDNGSSSSTSVALAVNSTTVTGLEIRNNILSNHNVSTVNGFQAFCIRYASGYPFATSGNIVNNNYYGIPPNTGTTSYFVGGTYATGVTAVNLSALQTLTGQDANSVPVINIPAPFTSNTNLVIPAGTATSIESGGVFIAALGSPNTDYNNVNRPAGTGTAPDIGAYEFEGVTATGCNAAPANGGTVTTNANSICSGQSVSLSVSGYTVDLGIEYRWSQSSSISGPFIPIPGATSTAGYTSGILTTNTYYRFEAVCTNTNQFTPSNVITITVNDPQVTGTSPGFLCGTGTVVLGATVSAGATAKWYENASGGAPIFTGTAYTTPVISTTTNYYVSASSGGTTANLASPSIGTSTFFSAATGWGLRFTVNSAATINSVTVRASNSTAGAASMQIKITDLADVVLYTGTLHNFNITTTLADYVIPVNISITPGTNYKMVMTSTGINNLVRESGGVTFPYNSPGNEVSITAGANGVTTAQTTSAYYWFYNWVISTGCESARQMVTANVVSAPAISATTPLSLVCSGGTTTLNASSSNAGYTYTWTPGNLVGASINVNPATTTTYTVTAVDNSGGSFNGCTVPATIVINAQPASATVIASPESICAASGNSTLSLSPSGITPGTIQWQESSNGVSYTNISGANNPTYNTPVITASTFYKALIMDGNNNTCIQPFTEINVGVPTVNSSTGNTRCGTGTTSLQATGSTGSTINWYTTSTGGSSIGTGSPFTTPVITGTTTFYAAAETGSGAPTTGVVGTGATTSATYSNPFYSLWSNTHNQHLILASELYAAGMSAGSIVAGGINITSAGTLPMIDFSLKLGHTTASNMSAFVSTAFTTVYTSPSLMPVVGLNSVAFNTPFIWDGVSNIVVEICHGNPSSGATMSRTASMDATSYISTIHTHRLAGTSAAVQCSDVTTTLTTYSTRPQFTFTYLPSCSSPRVAVVATVTPAPAITVAASTGTICPGGSATLSVTSGNDPNYSYVWSSVPAGFSATGSGPHTVSPSVTTEYFVTATDNSGGANQNCAMIESVTITNGGAIVAGTVTSTQEVLCFSGTPVLSLTGASGGANQWQSSTVSATGPWTNVGTGANSYSPGTVSQTTYYRVETSCGATALSSNVVTVTVNTPQVVSTVPGSRCGNGTVSISATPSTGTSINWYANATGGVPLATGNSYTTPVISATTNYYAASTSGGFNGSVGLPNRVGTTTNNGYSDVGLVFNATAPFTLTSVAVYPVGSGAATLTIALKNSAGTNLQSATVNVTASANPGVKTIIPLNFTVPAGTAHRLVMTAATGITGLIREATTGYTYPYTLAGVASITSAYTSGVSADYYYYFYDWQLSTGCESPRTLVPATIVPAPALSVISGDPGLCVGGSTTLSVSSTNDPNYTYSWTSNPAGFVQTGPGPFTISPTVTTKYYVSAVDNSGGSNNGCVITDSLNMIVTGTLVAGTVSASETNFCLTGTPTLTLAGHQGVIQWQSSTVSATGPWTNVGTGLVTYSPTLTQTTYIRASVSCQTTALESNVVTININNPQITSSSGATRCGAGTVTLSATPSSPASVKWFTTPTGGSPVSTGNIFTTTVTGTTTYYASASTGGGSTNTAAPASAGADGNYNLEAGLFFDAVVPFTIQTVHIYPIGTGAGTVVIELLSPSGATLQAYTFNGTGTTTPGVKTAVNVNFAVPAPGSQYAIVMKQRTGGITGLIRDYSGNIQGGGFPYTVPGSMTITTGRCCPSATSTAYYYFYDWQISSGCDGSRVPVTATVTPSIPATASTSQALVCAGNQSTISVSSANPNYVYTWTSTPAGFTATGPGPHTVTPSGTGTTYQVYGYDSGSDCGAIASVVVNTTPNVIVATATATPAGVCSGEDAQLTASATLPGYTVGSNPGPGFINIATTGTSIGTLSDDNELPIIIPSPGFNFNGVNYTYARVGTNGGILLGATTTGDVAAANTALPSTANGAYPFLAPYWDDLDIQTSAVISTQQVGNLFIIQFTNMAHDLFYTGSGITFQVQLDQSTGVIRFIYQDVVFGSSTYDFGLDATVGLQYSTSSAVQYSYNTASLSNGQTITYTPATSTFAYNWSANTSFLSATNIANPTAVAVTSPQNYTVVITDGNTGCTKSATVLLDVNPLPTPSAFNGGPYCENQIASFFAFGGLYYSWSGPNGFTSTDQNPSTNPLTVADGGTYTVTVEDANGCTASYDDYLVVNANPVVDYVTVSDETCLGAGDGSILIGISSGDGSYTTTDGGSLTSFDSPASFTPVAPGSYSFSISDGQNCATTTTATVGTVPNLPPVITCPGNVSISNAAGMCGSPYIYEVLAEDACPGIGSIIQTAGLPSGSTFPVGTTVNTFTVTDDLGVTSTCSFSVVVTDTENPTIANVPASFSSCNPITWTPPTITDNCPGVQVQSSHMPGTVFPSGTTTVTYTATDAYNHVTTVSFNVTVLEPSVAATSISSDRDFNNICLGENITLSVVGGSLGAGASWKWYSGSCNGTLVGTGSSIIVSPAVTTTYFVKAEGSCGPTTCTSVQVLVSTSAPLGSITYTVLPAYGAPGITDVISVNPVAGATYYQWSTNNGQIGGVLFNNLTSPVQTGVPTVNITFVQSQQNYQIRVLAGNACGRTGQANTHIRGTVAAPTSLTGPTQVCPNQTASYTVSAIPSQSPVTYNWALIPSSAGTISGTGLTRTVTFASGFTTAQLCVNGVSSFGLPGTPLCITISTSAPIPGAISGNVNPCSGGTETYSITPIPAASSYIWTVLGNVVPGANGPSATITFPAGTFAGNVCVQSVSTCGTSAPSCLAVVSGAPGNPGPISGPTQGICGATNVNYSLGTSGATYNWILPAGVTPSGPTNLNSINVNFSGTFAGGNIVVQAQYACGSPVSSTLAVSGEPTTPIVSPATICANSTELYFATSTGATGYNWTVTNAVDAFCTNPPVCSQYYAEWGPGGGSFSVTASNGCGTSAPFNLSTNCRTIETGELETKVYPNPTTGQFVVEISSYAGGNHNLTITDLSGRVVMMKDVKASSGMNQFEMDLGFANAGLYMLYVKDADGKISVTKIVVE